MNCCFKRYKDLVIDRRGTTKNSNMTTTKFIKEVKKNQNYKITQNNLQETNDTRCNKEISKIKQKNINKQFIKCNWDGSVMDLNTDNSNILGKSGKLIVNDNITIPIINSDELWYYGVKLYNIGDIISFELDLPFFEVEVGENYVKEYIMKKAGGVYLETHSRPHFHMPLSKESCGYIILGKKVPEGIDISAFRIPFGSALYMPNNIIHNDCFLIGKYNVIYSKTDDYKTMLLLNNEEKPVNIIVE